jgi:alpha-L-fucosidase
VVEGVVFETKDIHVRDTKLDPLGSQDIRFTSSKDASIVYAFIMDWPANEDLLISSLSKENTGKIASVELLGHGTVAWSQDSEGLKLKLPASAPSDYASAFKIKLK